MTTINATSFTLTVAGAKKWVTKLEPVALTDQPTYKSIHYIDIIDRSGSMYDSIDEVVDTLQALTHVMNKEDYRTVIWFSGIGEFRVVLKGVKNDPSLNLVLDSLRSTIGLTCFSESLQEMATSISEFSGLAENTVVNLFTDGNPTVSDIRKEMEKCCSLVTQVSDKVLAFNTIGFGDYYNRDFLVQLAGLSALGQFNHVRSIEDFAKIYTKTIENVANSYAQTIEVSSDVSDRILYASSATVVAKTGSLLLHSQDSQKNSFYVISDQQPANLKVLVNGENLSVACIKGKDADFPFIYAYVAYAWLNNRKLALDLLVSHTKDKNLATLVLESFTYDEIGYCTSQLLGAANDSSLRYLDGKCPPGFIPAKDAFCVMDLFSVLSSFDAEYVPQILLAATEDERFDKARQTIAPYTRVRRKTTDEFDVFKGVSVNPTSLDNLVYAEDRLNLSLRFTIDGYAELNPKAAKSVGLAEQYPCFVYRNHTFVKDGSLNISRAEFLLSEAAMERVTAVKKLKVLASMQEGDKIRAILDFSRLPILNQTYLDAAINPESIYTKVQDLTRLSAEQKAAKFYLEQISDKVEIGQDSGTFAKLTDEQIRVLKEHGITERGNYAGIDNKRDLKDNLDYYEVRELSFYLKGVSSLPSVSAVSKKLGSGKALTTAEQIMCTALNQLYASATSSSEPANFNFELEKPTLAQYNSFNAYLKKIKTELAAIRNTLSTYKMALVLTGSWFGEEVQVDDKGTALYKDMVVKTSRTKEYINP